MVVNVEEGFANGGPLVRTFSATRSALLSGFYFQYVDEDHNLSKRIDRHVLQVMALTRFRTARLATQHAKAKVLCTGGCIRPRPARDAENKGGP
jgi:hypothetical protein